MPVGIPGNSLSVKCMFLIDKLGRASAIKLYQLTGTLPYKINHTLRYNVNQGCLRKLGKKYVITSKGRQVLFDLLFPPRSK